MPVWRLQTSWLKDTAFPRDRMIINPVFDDHGATTDPDGLCEALANALETWHVNGGELRVTAYDAQGTVPVAPQGEAIRHVGATEPSPLCRELAICLSFFSGTNVGRKRGRLYVPACLTSTSSSAAARVDTTRMTKVAALVPIFTGLGGADVDWSIYSRLDDEARPVTNWFVDNDWDVVRSRGLRSDARQVGTASE